MTSPVNYHSRAQPRKLGIQQVLMAIKIQQETKKNQTPPPSQPIMQIAIGAVPAGNLNSEPTVTHET